MVKLSQVNAERDHVHWLEDYAAWMREVEEWQACDDDMLAELRRLYAYVIALKSAALGHAEVINKSTDICSRHAGTLAGGASRRQQGSMVFVHDQMAARHEHTRADHERIKAHHASVQRAFGELLESVAVRATEGETWNTID